jgi:hypothetical protein
VTQGIYPPPSNPDLESLLTGGLAPLPLTGVIEVSGLESSSKVIQDDLLRLTGQILEAEKESQFTLVGPTDQVISSGDASPRISLIDRILSFDPLTRLGKIIPNLGDVVGALYGAFDYQTDNQVPVHPFVSRFVPHSAAGRKRGGFVMAARCVVAGNRPGWRLAYINPVAGKTARQEEMKSEECPAYRRSQGEGLFVRRRLASFFGAAARGGA